MHSKSPEIYQQYRYIAKTIVAYLSPCSFNGLNYLG